MGMPPPVPTAACYLGREEGSVWGEEVCVASGIAILGRAYTKGGGLLGEGGSGRGSLKAHRPLAYKLQPFWI